MTFDPFRQAKLMTAYTGLSTATVPEREIDSIDDLKRLAGVNTSYGEETSEYATNLGQIQREQNIKPGTDEWFKLWFARPQLTGEQPFSESVQKYSVSPTDAEFLIEQSIDATSSRRFDMSGPNRKLFEHYDIVTARELITEKIIEEEHLVTENIDPTDSLLTDFYSVFNDSATGNQVNPGDQISVLELTATKFTKQVITLSGFIEQRTVDSIGYGAVHFTDGSVYPSSPRQTTQTRTWNQTILFKEQNNAEKCYTLMLLKLSGNSEWEFTDEVDKY